MLQASNQLIFTIMLTWVLSTPFFRGGGWGQDCFKATNTVSQIKFVRDMGRRKNRLWNNKGRMFHCQFVKIRCVSFCSCLLRTTRIHVHMHTCTHTIRRGRAILIHLLFPVDFDMTFVGLPNVRPLWGPQERLCIWSFQTSSQDKMLGQCLGAHQDTHPKHEELIH